MKDFLLIGNKNCIAHKDFFKLMMDRRVNIGYTRPGDFDQPDGTSLKTLQGLTRWFTILSVDDKPSLALTATYSPEKYPKYDNYDAINVNRVQDIPYDYEGVMGVPITIFDHNLDYEYDGCLYGDHTIIDGKYIKGHTPIVDGKHLYTRVLIRKKQD